MPLPSKPPISASGKAKGRSGKVPERKKKRQPVVAKRSRVPSDGESVMTEDYENHFQSMMVKQVANVPVVNFDQFMVDSDLDTVRSQVIREKFLSALSEYSVSCNNFANVNFAALVLISHFTI